MKRSETKVSKHICTITCQAFFHFPIPLVFTLSG
jgi:hypothetical protein